MMVIIVIGIVAAFVLALGRLIRSYAGNAAYLPFLYIGLILVIIVVYAAITKYTSRLQSMGES